MHGEASLWGKKTWNVSGCLETGGVEELEVTGEQDKSKTMWELMGEVRDGDCLFVFVWEVFLRGKFQRNFIIIPKLRWA